MSKFCPQINLLKTFIHAPGSCKMFSEGFNCRCPSCLLDELQQALDTDETMHVLRTTRQWIADEIFERSEEGNNPLPEIDAELRRLEEQQQLLFEEDAKPVAISEQPRATSLEPLPAEPAAESTAGLLNPGLWATILEYEGFKVGDHVKVKDTISEESSSQLRNLASAYGHILYFVDSAMVRVEFADYEASAPLKHLKVVKQFVPAKS